MKKILSFLDEHFEEYLLIAILGIMSIVICYQVFMRYVMAASLSWSEELARYLFIWMAYICLLYTSLVTRNRTERPHGALL